MFPEFYIAISLLGAYTNLEKESKRKANHGPDHDVMDVIDEMIKE